MTRGFLQNFLGEYPVVTIKQHRHLSEMLVPIERANTYAIGCE